MPTMSHLTLKFSSQCLPWVIWANTQANAPRTHLMALLSSCSAPTVKPFQLRCSWWRTCRKISVQVSRRRMVCSATMKTVTYPRRPKYKIYLLKSAREKDYAKWQFLKLSSPLLAATQRINWWWSPSAARNLLECLSLVRWSGRTLLRWFLRWISPWYSFSSFISTRKSFASGERLSLLTWATRQSPTLLWGSRTCRTLNSTRIACHNLKLC